MSMESDERRSRVLRRRRPREHEDARADDRADAQRGEVEGTEGTAQEPALGLEGEVGDGFAKEERHAGEGRASRDCDASHHAEGKR